MIRSGALAGLLLFGARLLPAGSIEGRVANHATGAGIGGVSVMVVIPQATTQFAETDATGTFRLDEVPDGECTVTVRKSGLIQLVTGSLRVQVSGKTRVDLQMSPLATLRGRVLDPDDKPAEGVTVKLTGSVDAVTNEDGLFVFDDVAPGLRKLCAIPKPQQVATDEDRVATTCYPSVVGRDGALEINVGDTDLFGFDVRLRRAPLRSIRGNVVGEDGKPEQNATVVLYKAASQNGMVLPAPFNPPAGYQNGEEHLIAGDDGAFEFSEVAEGDWLLRAIVTRHDADNNREIYRNGVAELKVGRTDVEGFKVHTEGGFSIDYSADWGDLPSDKAPVQRLVSLAALDGQLSTDPRIGFSGRYFVDRPSTVKLGPGGRVAAGYYLAAVMLGSQDVLGQVLNLSGPTSLKLIFKKGGGTVHGNVGKIVNGWVALLADGASVAHFGFFTFCDENGRFSIPDVPPGEYTAVAFEGFDMGVQAMLNLAAARGERVKVEDGAAVQVDLRLPAQQ